MPYGTVFVFPGVLPTAARLPGVTTCARAFMIVGAGLLLSTGMSVFTITTITAFFVGQVVCAAVVAGQLAGVAEPAVIDADADAVGALGRVGRHGHPGQPLLLHLGRDRANRSCTTPPMCAGRPLWR
jgi:hypothetical protein